MTKADRKKINDLIHKLAIRYNMSDEDMKRLVESPYEFAHSKIKELNLEDIETEEDFNKKKTNFIMPSFLRLVIDYKSLEARRNRRKNIKKINKKE